MQILLNWTLLLLQLIVTGITVETASPYCYKNVTETSYRKVTKTRLITVNSKGFFKKLSFKKDTQVEIYDDLESVYKIKIERTCCEGYKLTELDLCEPQCEENGCPQHAKCIEPEVCECLKGYFSKLLSDDGKHYCEPICDKPCPEHSVCVAPNECACKKGFHVMEDLQCKPFCASGCPYAGKCVAPNVCDCQEGYKSEKGSCLPICSVGDQCLDGKCVKQEECLCNYGFSWNVVTQKCETDRSKESDYIVSPTTTYSDLTEPQQANESSLEMETDIETSNDDIDPNQVFDELIESTTSYITDEYGSSTSPTLKENHKCPDDYVFHKGQCHPLKFASNEISCWLKPCQDKNAFCLENGTCACKEGFQWFRTHVVDNNSKNQTIKPVCLTLLQHENKTKHLQENPQKGTSWTLIFFIVIGILVMTLALVFLVFKLLHRQRGEMDVEGKNLACTYDNRACCDTEKSVI